MRRGARGLAWLVAAAALAANGALLGSACSAATQDLQVEFWQDYLSRGFICLVDAGNGKMEPSYDRLKGTGTFSVVADLIAVNEVTNGTLAEVSDVCDGGQCPFVGARQCTTLTTPTLDGSPSGAVGAFQGVVDTLNAQGFVITADAPHQQVVVRIVFTAQACDVVLTDQSAGFDREELVACAISVPFDPDQAAGPITLDLDVPSDEKLCEPVVCACAELSSANAGVCTSSN